MSRRTYDALFTLAIALVFAWALWQSLAWDQRAGLFPWLITSVMLALTLVQLRLVLRGREQAVSALTAGVEYDLPPAVVHRRTAIISAWILGFVATIWLIGFPPAVPLLTFLYLKFGAREGWPLSVGLAVVAGALFYALFVRMLTIFFERGVLLRLLGL
jgi:hypothetical protein